MPKSMFVPGLLYGGLAVACIATPGVAACADGSVAAVEVTQCAPAVDRPPGARPATVLETDLFAFRSDMRFNLHDFLVWNAREAEPVDPRPTCLAALPDAEREGWKHARAHYAETFNRAEPFDRLVVALWFELAGFALVEIVPDEERAPSRQHLDAAEAAYRACWWADHDARNRAWIAALAPSLDAHERALRAGHARALGADWSGRIPVDVVGYVSWAGAGTLVDPNHILVSSADPRHHGDAALEVVFHEASHTLLGPGRGAVWDALVDAVAPAHELWHPLLFHTSGWLVARRLAERGSPGYVPYVYRNGLYERAWPALREPIETHWEPYLEGRIDLQEAAERLVAATSEAAPPKEEGSP